MTELHECRIWQKFIIQDIDYWYQKHFYKNKEVLFEVCMRKYFAMVKEYTKEQNYDSRFKSFLSGKISGSDS